MAVVTDDGCNRWRLEVTDGGCNTGGQLQSVLMRPTPQLSVKTCRGGGVGGRVGGGLAARRGGGGSQEGWGLRATHYYHMHTSRGCVCLGAWGYRGMYAILAISRLCQEESLQGLKDQRHSPSSKHGKKKPGAVGAMAPAPLSFKTRGGRGGGGVAYKDRARPPPRGL